MGFDVYGMNPVMREIDESKYALYNKYNPMEFADRMKVFKDEEGLEKKFYSEMNEREEENPGVYFRNNVWWWRPLWNYVCEECDYILEEDDYESGCDNSGHHITEEKASAIAKRLFELIEKGETKEYDDYHRKQAEKAEKDNKILENKTGKKYGDGWNWADSYPFDVENVRNFATFCSESGGFEIC